MFLIAAALITKSTQLVTASDDDQNPIIYMWDLRNSRAPEKPLLGAALSKFLIFAGHNKGVLSLSWSLQDSELLLSCGKDNRTLCWNPSTAEVIGEVFPPTPLTEFACSSPLAKIGHLTCSGVRRIRICSARPHLTGRWVTRCLETFCVDFSLFCAIEIHLGVSIECNAFRSVCRWKSCSHSCSLQCPRQQPAILTQAASKMAPSNGGRLVFLWQSIGHFFHFGC